MLIATNQIVSSPNSSPPISKPHPVEGSWNLIPANHRPSIILLYCTISFRVSSSSTMSKLIPFSFSANCKSLRDFSAYYTLDIALTANLSPCLICCLSTCMFWFLVRSPLGGGGINQQHQASLKQVDGQFCSRELLSTCTHHPWAMSPVPQETPPPLQPGQRPYPPSIRSSTMSVTTLILCQIV